MRNEALSCDAVQRLTAEALGKALLSASEAMPGDRVFALAHGDARFDQAAPRLAAQAACRLLACRLLVGCWHVGCQMANPRLAAVHALWHERSAVLLLRLPAERPFAGDTATAEARAAIGERLAAAVGPEARGRPRLVHAAGHRFAKHPDRLSSLLNLASLATLERAMGGARSVAIPFALPLFGRRARGGAGLGRAADRTGPCSLARGGDDRALRRHGGKLADRGARLRPPRAPALRLRAREVRRLGEGERAGRIAVGDSLGLREEA